MSPNGDNRRRASLLLRNVRECWSAIWPKWKHFIFLHLPCWHVALVAKMTGLLRHVKNCDNFFDRLGRALDRIVNIIRRIGSYWLVCRANVSTVLNSGLLLRCLLLPFFKPFRHPSALSFDGIVQDVLRYTEVAWQLLSLASSAPSAARRVIARSSYIPCPPTA